MTIVRSELLQGTLDMLVLKILSLKPLHGWGISERIEQMSGEVFQVNQGSLYPALHRLEKKGWIRARKGKTQTGRSANFYRLTPDGLRNLEAEEAKWIEYSDAMHTVFNKARD